MVTKEEIREYYSNFLEHFKNDQGGTNPRHQKVFKDLRKIIKPNMKVLDIGCGTGVTSLFMAEECDAFTHAVDISPVLIEYARRYNSHKKLSYSVQDVVAGNPLSTEQLSLYYEVITVIDCLEHIPIENAIDNFFNYITTFSSNETVVYINIPDSRFINYMQKYHPDKLQIVDEAWASYALIGEMSYHGFELTNLEIYGLDVPVQYNSYVFAREETINSGYSVRFS